MLRLISKSISVMAMTLLVSLPAAAGRFDPPPADLPGPPAELLGPPSNLPGPKVDRPASTNIPPYEPIPEDGDAIPLHECPTREQLRAAIKPIGEIQAKLAVDPELVGEEGSPLNCAYYVFDARQRARARFPELTQFSWQPTNFFHQPLYFDDQPLERYGQTSCWPLQPVFSGTRFFLTLPVIPYKIGLNPLHEPVTTLGYYRPGGCAPCLREKVIPAFEIDAALLEAGTALAIIFVLP